MAEADTPTRQQSERSRDGSAAHPARERAREVGGPKGPEPTRYGDWEVRGRCSDF